jgi:H+/Cl- antiporter ClcA
MDLFLNPHLIPFKIIIVLGALFIGLAPFNYSRRTGQSTGITNLVNYSKKEWKLFFVGIILLMIGMIGNSSMKDKYGYNVRVTDIDGNVTIENSKTW